MERPGDYMDTILGMTMFVYVCVSVYLKSSVCPCENEQVLVATHVYTLHIIWLIGQADMKKICLMKFINIFKALIYLPQKSSIGQAIMMCMYLQHSVYVLEHM